MLRIEAVEHSVNGLQVRGVRALLEGKSGLRLCRSQRSHKAVVAVNVLSRQDMSLQGDVVRPITSKETDSMHANSSAAVSN
jgi:hypothetical protein